MRVHITRDQLAPGDQYLFSSAQAGAVLGGGPKRPKELERLNFVPRPSAQTPGRRSLATYTLTEVVCMLVADALAEATSSEVARLVVNELLADPTVFAVRGHVFPRVASGHLWVVVNEPTTAQSGIPVDYVRQGTVGQPTPVRIGRSPHGEWVVYKLVAQVPDDDCRRFDALADLMRTLGPHSSPRLFLGVVVLLDFADLIERVRQWHGYFHPDDSADLDENPDSSLCVTGEDSLLTPIQACKALGRSLPWLRLRTRQGKLPTYRVGRLLRFRQSELRQWAAEHGLAYQNPQNEGA